MEARSWCSYLMEDICFNNFLIRYGTLKFNIFFLLRWWQNWTSKNRENGEQQNRNNLEEYRAKELQRVQSYKSHQNQSTFRQKHHEATCRWHEGKKILEGTPTNISPAKMSSQSLGKAVKCVTKALTKSPSKEKSVVCALAKSFGVMNTEKKVINLGLSACDKEAIQNFNQWEDISLYMPGKQDVTVRDKNGKRKEQKQVLTMTVAEVHSLFVGENPTIVVGKSKFAELWLAEVLLLSKMLHVLCQHGTFTGRTL